MLAPPKEYYSLPVSTDSTLVLWMNLAIRHGVEGRNLRHQSRVKNCPCHIDALLKYWKSIARFHVFTSESDGESRLAKAPGERLSSVSGFGCSDCGCESHLFCRGFEGGDDKKGP
ncbi:hypothetical protein AMJ40_07785 [candidate division TA06 bacterium DG_26]|uniref:Uncharacterized protein n=1 Tax=candidate division TA06 bacterium DG_26 TaxID=1703771 RepID=A0A0S7WDR2_UNCT6|nr:MAG: hypothetical protein AMJ40_07785 [candidate division TA06 bacterium DG_26]